MAVKIRLARRGRKKQAMYDVVVADARAPRDGRFIEKLGTYNPNTNPATIVLDEEKAFKWVMNGAQPTDTVKALLSYRGVLLRKHLQIGVIKEALTQDQADAKYDAWKSGKDSAITGKVESLATEKAVREKAKFEAEAKVKEARAEAIKAKNVVVEEPSAEEVAVEEPAAAEEPAIEESATVEATNEEAAAEEPAAEEVAPAEAAAEEPATEKVATVESTNEEAPTNEAEANDAPAAEGDATEEPKA